MAETTVTLSAGGKSVTMTEEEFIDAVNQGSDVDLETGELVPHQQPTLDDAMFQPLKVSTVRVNFSGAAQLSLPNLRAYLDGAALTPGRDVEVTLQGYVAGAGVKWKRGGEGGPAGALSIVLTDLLTLTVQATSYTTEEMDEDRGSDE